MVDKLQGTWREQWSTPQDVYKRQAMDYAQSVPSLSQAQRIKALSKSGKLTLEEMQDILSEIDVYKRQLSDRSYASTGKALH